MHYVECGPAPEDSLKRCTIQGQGGKPDLKPDRCFYNHLDQLFSSLCGYRERIVYRPWDDDERLAVGEVEHFRPKVRFPELACAWENLVYSCHRCNQAKGGQFPAGADDNNRLDELKAQLERLKATKDPRDLGQDDRLSQREKLIEERIKATKRSNEEIQRLATKFGREFVHPSDKDGYVNPRDPDNKKAECFFSFERSGKRVDILPAEKLDDLEWSKAVRTIADLDLNPDDTGVNSLNSLRVAAWNYFSIIKGLMLRNPDLAEQIRSQWEDEFPTLAKWVLKS